MSGLWLRRLTFVLVLPMLMAACATLKPAGATSNHAQAQADHSAIDLSGRLSVLYQHNGKDEALHGSFTWLQTNTDTRISLLSPLGQTIAQILVTPNSATLTQADKIAHTAADVDTLTAETLGWPLPISGLRDWMQGYATLADGTRFVANPQTNSVTTGDGWRIRYVTWHDDTSPKRIDLARHTDYAGEVTLRIIVDQRSTP